MARFCRIVSLLPALAAVCGVHAQQNDIPLDRDIYYGIDRNGAMKGSTMHTGLRPVLESRAELDHVMGWTVDSTHQYYWFTDKLLKSHLVDVHDGGFRVTIDPLFDLQVGQEVGQSTRAENARDLGQNGRGFYITADLGPTVSFQTAFRENQAFLAEYLYRFTQARGVVPGQGRIKTFNARGLDFAWATANVSWSPRPWLNAQVGQGKQFVGNGYRSMLLSDNAMVYPYIKLSALTNNKRFQYSIIHAKLQMNGDANRLPTGDAAESLFYWKRASFHHLSINLGPAQLGLFEATLWNDVDTIDGIHAYNAMELNPVIGLNTIVNGFGGRNKQLDGVDLKYRLTDGFFLYGQYALDDPARNRYAWQLGGQWFGRVMRRNAHLLLEYNSATPFAYTAHDARMNYVHMGQALAGPLGSGYDEAVAIVDVDLGHRVWVKAQVSLATLRTDTLAGSLSGGDIYRNDLSTGLPTETLTRQRTWIDVNVAYRMNPHTNLRILVGWSSRAISPAYADLSSDFVYVTLRTGLFNRYYDL